MIQDNVANGECYADVCSDSVAAVPQVTAEEWCKPSAMQDRTYPEDNSTEFGATRVDRNQSQGYDAHQWFYPIPTAIMGANDAYRANTTNMRIPSYSSDAGQVSRSPFPANIEPWLAVGVSPRGFNILSTHCARNSQWSEEFSHYPENRNSSASSFVDSAGAITSDPSWPNNVIDQAVPYYLGQSVLAVRTKDVEHEAQGLQEQGTSPFRYNVQEGSPSIENDVYDPVTALNDAR